MANLDIDKLKELVYDLGDIDGQRFSKDGFEIYNLICQHINVEPYPGDYRIEEVQDDVNDTEWNDTRESLWTKPRVPK